MIRLIRQVLAVICVLAALGLYVVYSGIYNVSADGVPPRFERWLFGTLSDRSIARHARGIQVPDLRAEDHAAAGYQVFRAQCTSCHGAPGVPPDGFGMGLYPPAPSLNGSEVQEWSDSELYWIAKNGIRHTGMPAFGFVLSDEELWNLVAFLRRLPELSDDAFRTFGERAETPAEAPSP